MLRVPSKSESEKEGPNMLVATAGSTRAGLGTSRLSRGFCLVVIFLPGYRCSDGVSDPDARKMASSRSRKAKLGTERSQSVRWGK